jgi:dienelactone hydrolase
MPNLREFHPHPLDRALEASRNGFTQDGHTPAVETIEYAPARLADLYGEPSHPTVLLWHGMQTDSRAAVRPLAERVAGHGLYVVAPDWNSHADDRGRADLLQSVQFAQHRTDNSCALVLVGWSLGGAAAAGLTIKAAQYGVALKHTVCLAGAFTAGDPLSGSPVADILTGDATGTPFTLLHGTRDDVIPVVVSETFAESLTEVGWPAEVVELDTDHGAIAGARYDATAERYSPAGDAQTLAVASDVAARIAAVTLDSR